MLQIAKKLISYARNAGTHNYGWVFYYSSTLSSIVSITRVLEQP